MLESAWGICYETLQVGKVGASLIPFILLKDGAWERSGDGLRNLFGNRENISGARKGQAGASGLLCLPRNLMGLRVQANLQI